MKKNGGWSKGKKVALATVVVYTGLWIVARVYRKLSVYGNEAKEKNRFQGKRITFVLSDLDQMNADGIRGHLESLGDCKICRKIYDTYVKRCLDLILSFLGLVFLAPLMLLIAVVIVIDDPGPVMFVQKRVGRDKEFFRLHKFRTMKMCTPSNTPTHMLENPEQYITRIGKLLRKYSLDELPQIWDIFIGNMSVIGPRPALWNQDLLIAERERYGANDIRPGLTGWAQINGRDELSIEEKAKLDGEYCLRESFFFDCKCFVGTLTQVLKADGVVEGRQTEESNTVGKRFYTEKKTEEELIGQIGFGKNVELDTETVKMVLITGAGSYIGEYFRSYVEQREGNQLIIDTLDMMDERWEKADFSTYDIVYHVAGIAHADVGNVDTATKEKYYQVNTDLAVQVCKKAKAEGVGTFIFMSSMIVYGDSAPFGVPKKIDAFTVPKPDNFYGDSKLQADVAVRELAGDGFQVMVLRPPMIFGAGSKGNYPLLAKIAGKVPVFPNSVNERSMLYIENFCEFLYQIMLVKAYDRDAIVLFPQNREWTNTCQMVQKIAEARGKRMHLFSLLNCGVCMGSRMPGKVGKLVNKAFGNLAYSKELSIYLGLEYQRYTLQESIKRTEEGVRMEQIAGNSRNIGEESFHDGEMKTDKKRPLVSIITVSFNSEKTIRKTIEAVLEQTYSIIEYRIVDGASTDQTVAIAKEYEDRFAEKGIPYLITSEPDDGIYDAMNKGIRDAKGELIGIINSDDWYEKNAIETVVHTYEREHFDYYYADLNIIKADGSIAVKHSKEDLLATSHHWNHPTCFVTKQTYEQLGVFRCEGIHDDFDFFLRVKKAGRKIVIENKVIANFRADGVSHQKSLQKSIGRCRDRYQCYQNNRYSPLYLVECVAIEMAKYVLQ